MAGPRVEGLEFGDLLLIGRVLEFKKVYITGSLCFADGSSVSLAQERIGMQKVQECVLVSGEWKFRFGFGICRFSAGRQVHIAASKVHV